MCGIAGILSLDGRPVAAEDIESMCSAIVHRGPDDGGVFVRPEVGLGMRRLSSIDLHTGHQPLSNEDGSVWVVFKHLSLLEGLKVLVAVVLTLAPAISGEAYWALVPGNVRGHAVSDATAPAVGATEVPHAEVDADVQLALPHAAIRPAWPLAIRFSLQTSCGAAAFVTTALLIKRRRLGVLADVLRAVRT